MKEYILKNKDNIILFFFSMIFHLFVIVLACLILSLYGQSDLFRHVILRLTEAGDAPHYLYLAQNGYASVGEKTNLIVFYPLYPFLVGILGRITTFEFAGLIISNITFAFSCVLLKELLCMDYDKEKTLYGIMMFLVFPAFIFGMGVFTEGLFLMLSVWCMLLIRKRDFAMAGLIGMFCALTRAQGVLLIIPALYELILAIRKKEYKEKKINALPLLFIPTGFFLYLLLNLIKTGDAFAFVKFEAMEPWYNTMNFVAENISTHYSLAKEYFGLSIYIYGPQIFLFFFTIAVLLIGIKNKVNTSVIIYGFVYLFVTYLHGWMISGLRYMMSCFPIFLILPSIKNRNVRNTILAVFGVFSLLFTYYILEGQAIM